MVIRNYFWHIIFVFLTLSICLIEGLGIHGGRIISFSLIIASPCLLLFADMCSSVPKKIFLPKVFYLFAGFLLMSLVSAVFSINQEQSLLYFLYYCSLVLLFILVSSYKKEVIMYFPKLLVFLGILFSVSTLFLVTYGFDKITLIPQSGYQLVFPYFSSHNYIGDYLIVPLLWLIHASIHKKSQLYVGIFILLFPFFLFSYSRSAYLAFSIGMACLFYQSLHDRKVNLSKVKKGLFIGGIMISLFFVTIVSSNFHLPVVSSIHSFFVENLRLVSDRTFESKRLIYFGQAIESIQKNPLVGIGPGNFYQISQQTYSTHNIFLDVFVEHGIIAGLFFLAIIGYFLLKAKKDIMFVLFLSLLIDFQTDYAFTIYAMLYIFFIIMALLEEQKQ